MEASGCRRQEPRSPTSLPFRSGDSPLSSPLARELGSHPSSGFSSGASCGQRLFRVLHVAALLCRFLLKQVLRGAAALSLATREVCRSCCSGLGRALSDAGWSSCPWETDGVYADGAGAAGSGSGRDDGKKTGPPCRLRLLLSGPRQAGKTALLYRLKIGGFIPTVPSMGVQREEFSVTLDVHRPAAPSAPGPQAVSSKTKFSASANARQSSSKAGRPQRSDSPGALDRASSVSLLEEGFMSGADAAGGGKSSRLVEAPVPSPVPCTVERRKCSLVVWDLAGGDGIETRWRATQEACDAVVYVLDSTLFTGLEKSSVKQRALEDARREILALFYEEYFVLHKNVRFLLFASKQDLRSAAPALQVLELLDLPEDLRERLHVVPCSAVSGEGLLKGLEWLSSTARCSCFSAGDGDRSTVDSSWLPPSCPAAKPTASAVQDAECSSSGGRESPSTGKAWRSNPSCQACTKGHTFLPEPGVSGQLCAPATAERPGASAAWNEAETNDILGQAGAETCEKPRSAGRRDAPAVDLLSFRQELRDPVDVSTGSQRSAQMAELEL
ncbi:small GTP-binding protein domain containing protein, related [Neospora caninum Liverpool]|uniref:Small GTP-binding protein domain containing protein, related n=1 Tax=Neospora caninum (strain Liverpool) TaxID=572307 RepID=F0VBL8_NEOCL|nr:small GTP-binding protein domain containing protein, related [Neospora caninum Liverpool]CBZ51002.1 small GTP-binding protein domain containing protein, related [Neospora caninum Liverpool]CEL68307.1 TPA: Small GTP-binding protein domain containing protein, related [Neospora caninum Liverpool]|eukprot:XP_003881035.1 small GTP-binding protein domain containing protein, related [Neospora caninum Liverpool]